MSMFTGKRRCGESGSALMQVVIVSALMLSLILMLRHRLDSQRQEMFKIRNQGLAEVLVRYLGARVDCAYTLTAGGCKASQALYGKDKKVIVNADGGTKFGPLSVEAQCSSVTRKIVIVMKNRDTPAGRGRPICE